MQTMTTTFSIRFRILAKVQFLAIRVDKNAAILGQPSFQFLAIKVGRNAAILDYPDTFKMKYIKFLY